MQSPKTKIFIKMKLFLVLWDVLKKNAKKIFLTPLDLVRKYNSPKPYCSPSIIIQENFHLSKHPRERFDRFFELNKKYCLPNFPTGLLNLKVSIVEVKSGDIWISKHSLVETLRLYKHSLV